MVKIRCSQARARVILRGHGVRMNASKVQKFPCGLQQTLRVIWCPIVHTTRLGFEPRRREPKSLVLPLHYRVKTTLLHAIVRSWTWKANCSSCMTKSTLTNLTESGKRRTVGAKLRMPRIPARQSRSATIGAASAGAVKSASSARKSGSRTSNSSKAYTGRAPTRCPIFAGSTSNRATI